jgi:hypothetical protein
MVEVLSGFRINFAFQEKTIMQDRLLSRKSPFYALLSKTALVFLPFIFCACAHSNTTTRSPFLYGLDLKNYEQKGPVQVYNSRNIFEYMNGEAENYLPRGFNLLYVGNFLVTGKDSEMVMEIYDMGSPGGAESIFNLYARPPGEAVKGIGEGAWKSKSRCVFHRGPYFIRITADPAAGPSSRPSPGDIEALARESNQVLGK